MGTYDVTVRRDGRFWYVDIEGVGATQARHLREVEEMARDYVAVMHGVEPMTIDLDITIELDDDVRARLDAANRLREQADQAQTAASREVRAAARALRNQGLPLRDIGIVLGVSYQRAHQLLGS